MYINMPSFYNNFDFGQPNIYYQNNLQLETNCLMMLLMVKICTELLKMNQNNWFMPNNSFPKNVNKQQYFKIPSFSVLDNNSNGKISLSEFMDEYGNQNKTKSFEDVKKEANNIYNAIRGDKDNIDKEHYGAFLDIIDETDGILDGQYYQNNAQNLINKIKECPKSEIKDNKTLFQLIQEKLGNKTVKPNDDEKKTEKVNSKEIKEEDKPYTERRDYEITKVEQGNIGNCFLLSALAKHPEWIKDSGCLKWNDDGSADVFLYDSEKKLDNGKNAWVYKTTSEKKTYHLTKQELEQSSFELTKNNGEKFTARINPKQDFTLKAIELGYLKSCKFNYEKSFGGNTSRVIKMLFGDEKYKDMTYYCTPGNYNIDDLKNCTTVVIQKTDTSAAIAASFNNPKILDYHEYTFNGYNPETGMISISNPWEDDIKSTQDNVEIPWEKFKNAFTVELLVDKDKKPLKALPLVSKIS